MKLAEALIVRADAQKRLQQLRDRLAHSARVQEGDTPAEDPQALIREIEATVALITRLVRQINRTNAQTAFDDQRTLTDALADRDALALERSVLHPTIAETSVQQFRYSRTEIRYVSIVDVGAMQRRLDDLARRHRELDTRIQALNWQVDLIE